MKRVILNENQVETLLEYAGYVNVFERLTDIVVERFYERLIDNGMLNGFDLRNSNQEIIDAYRDALYNNKLKVPFRGIVVKPYDEANMNFCRLEHLYVLPRTDAMGGSFDPKKLSYNKEKNSFTYITIYVNPMLCLNDKNKKVLNTVIQHELTHAYEFMNRIVKNGQEKTYDEFDNKYYSRPDSNSIVERLSYVLSKMELNAMISELWRYFLEQKTEGWFLSTDVKYSTIGKKYAEIEQLKYNFEHDINNTYEVMEFIHMYPQYASMFPKTRNNNVYSMQRRIVRALDYKLNYIKNKVNRLIKRYKNELAQGKLRYSDEDI